MRSYRLARTSKASTLIQFLRYVRKSSITLLLAIALMTWLCHFLNSEMLEGLGP